MPKPSNFCGSEAFDPPPPGEVAPHAVCQGGRPPGRSPSTDPSHFGPVELEGDGPNRLAL
jgi:hypothetical protein